MQPQAAGHAPTSALEAPTLWALIEARAAATPDAPMLIDESGRTLTFDQFRQAAEVAAAGLHPRVTARDTVAWQLPTWIETYVLMAALARLGARSLALMPMLRTAEIVPLLRRAEVGFWCLPSSWRKTDYRALAREVSDQVPGIVVEFCDRSLPSGDPADLPAPPSSGTESRWIFPTSGTTSEPKGVLHSDRSIMAAATAASEVQGVRSDDRNGIAFPISHIGGVHNLAAALSIGHTLVIDEMFQPERTAEIFRRNDVTLAGGGPVFYAAYLDLQRKQPDVPILPKLRLMSGGGAPMPPALHAQVRDEIGGLGCLQGYGMTESCVVAMNRPGDDDRLLSHSVGKPLPSVEVRIVDASGPVPTGVDGDIRIRGASVCQGYLDESAQPWDEEGWFKTGDIGHFDEEGYLFITGRSKDIIIRKGENISAPELERVLGTHPDIAEVAVIGLPDPERGERVCAVVRTDRADLSLADIVEHCRESGLMSQKFPEQVELIDEFPHNTTGKILKDELRRRYAAST
ncbi:class I adenylate-forming enzyme family protein [Enemella sp. A6]|uniref:class I adenylate-forming enzyme family protein n=1 Tax=Enemella sp. A6 TaxID=3440152 RepID=UPI003EBE5D1B